MRPIDADKLPVTHGLFTPLGGNTFLDYDAVMIKDIQNAPTIIADENQIAAKPVYRKTCTGGPRPDHIWYYCKVCRRRLAFADKYCRECGKKIDWAAIEQI